MILGNEAAMRIIEAFLDEGAESKTDAELPSGTAIILFADIADSTGLTERLGDSAFRDKARGLDGTLRTVIREHSGTPVEGKLLGDGVLAVFTSARQAIECALRCGKAGEAAAGETLVSGTVRDLARTSAGVSFEDRGERELKGVGDPVRMFAVRGDA